MPPPRPSPPWLAKGFRPFFPLASAWAVGSVGVWIHAVASGAAVAPYFPAPYWHAHELVHGFAAAVLAGFLLTAASNWTSRETLTGPWLGALAGVWLAGRVAVGLGAALPPGVAAAADLAFYPALLVGLGRAIVASRSRRNYGFLGLIAALAAANGAMHAGALGALPGGLQRGAVVGVELVALVIVIVTGRVLPMFTRNATGAAVRSAPWADRLSIAALALLVAGDTFGAGARETAAFAAVGAAAMVARARGWQGWASRRAPLLAVLHVGHAFVPLGLALRALAGVGAAPWSAWVHALGAGAIGTLALGMMTRVGLGHTGRPLVAGPAMSAAFALVAAGALARVGVAFAAPARQASLLVPAGAAWCAGFALHLAVCAPALSRPRIDGRPG